MAINKMEEAIKTYQGVNYPNKELWVEAIDYGEKAIEAEPDFIEAHYRLAQIYQYTNWYYREAREWERYIELIQKKEVISPEAEQKLAFAYYRLGYAAYQREDYDSCILYLQKAVEVDPEMTEAHYWLGRVFYEIGRLNDSFSSWQKVLEIDPYYPRAQYFYTKVENSIKYGKEAYSHYEAGYNLYEQRLFEEAIYEYRQAVRYNSDFSSAYYWLGRIYYERGNYREAVSNWKEVLRLEPENTKAEYWLKQAEKHN
jgi:tetratricopeptide (TPR) repeat protein